MYACVDDVGVEFLAWWNSRRINAGPDDLSKCPPHDVRRMATSRGLDLTIVDAGSISVDYIPGTLAGVSNARQ